jgi:hypothetical protein
MFTGIELELAKTGAIESSIGQETRSRREDMDVMTRQLREQRNDAGTDEDDW